MPGRPRRSERRKTQKDSSGSAAGTNSGSNGSSGGNKGSGKGKNGSNDSGSPGVRSLRPRPGKPKAPNGAKAGRGEKANRNGSKKKSSPKKDSSSYVSPSGEEYKPGGELRGHMSCGVRGELLVVFCRGLCCRFRVRRQPTPRPPLPHLQDPPVQVCKWPLLLLSVCAGCGSVCVCVCERLSLMVRERSCCPRIPRNESLFI